MKLSNESGDCRRGSQKDEEELLSLSFSVQFSMQLLMHLLVGRKRRSRKDQRRRDGGAEERSRYNSSGVCALLNSWVTKDRTSHV
jgi:hypothetical protein